MEGTQPTESHRRSPQGETFTRSQQLFYVAKSLSFIMLCLYIFLLVFYYYNFFGYFVILL